MTPLDKLRDELEKKYYGAKFHKGWVCADFRAGFDAAIKALTDASGEFDAQAADAEGDKLETGMDYGGDSASFVWSARWQFEKDRARIGLAESRLKHCENTRLKDWIEGEEE